MNKTIIKTMAASLIAASLFSVMPSKPVEADGFGKCGHVRNYNKCMAAAFYAQSLVDKSYYQMPDPVQIGDHWCAAFTKYLYGETEKYTKLNSVTETVNKYKGIGRFHYSNDRNYHPGTGDLIVYEETGEEFNDGYEHIGVVIDVKTIDGEYYPSTIEGNYFDIPMKDEELKNITYDQYRNMSNSKGNEFYNRRVGKLPYNRVRRHMIAGYIEMDRTTIDNICGDVNGDGEVTPSDATLILRAIMNMDMHGGVLTKSFVSDYNIPEFYYRLDANGDGKVEQSDATIVLRYALKKDLQR